MHDRLVLVGFSTRLKFRNELTMSAEVPLHTLLGRFGFWKHINILYNHYKIKSARTELKLNWKQTEANELNCISNKSNHKKTSNKSKLKTTQKRKRKKQFRATF